MVEDEADSDQEVVEEWAARTRSNVRTRDPASLPPISALKLLGELFPELMDDANKMIDFVLRLR